MEFDKSYIAPSIYSLGLHILVIALLLWQWNSRPPLDILKAQQRIVASVAMKHSDLEKIDQQNKNQKKVEPPKPKPEVKPEPPKPDPEAIALEKQKEKEKLEAQKKQDEQKKKEEQQKKDEQKKKDEAKKKAAKQKNELLAEAENELKAKVTAPPTDQTQNAVDAPAVGALDGDEDVARIAAKVTSNWSQPSSYRKGMTVLLVVDLLPDGTVVDVKIAESSGDKGFDNSAEAAVRKSSPLPVPQDPKRFEAYFRKLNFQFIPE